MRKRLAWLSMTVLVGAFVLTALTCVRSPAGHCDFSLRMNEVECLRLGVNPFDVWHEDVVLPPYCSSAPRKPVPPGCTENVNAYSPWGYTLMLPFSFMPRPVAWTLYCMLMGILEIVVFLVAYRVQSADISRSDRLLTASVPLVVVSYLLWSNAAVGNFAVLVLAASVLMTVFLSRRRDALAGVCWALAMIKPQSAILFAVPLLLRRRWLSVAVAAGICLGLSIVPMAMCNASIFNLLLQGPAANAELFQGCGTYPRFLLGTFAPNVEIPVGLTVGLVLCCIMTWMLRDEEDWFVLLMPAAVCAASWTYTQAYSHAMCWFCVFVILRELVPRPRSKFLWGMLAVAVFSLSRWFLAWHGVCGFIGWTFPMSEYAFRCLDSLNSTLSLSIALVFCAWKRQWLNPAGFTTDSPGGM